MSGVLLLWVLAALWYAARSAMKGGVTTAALKNGEDSRWCTTCRQATCTGLLARDLLSSVVHFVKQVLYDSSCLVSYRTQASSTAV
jgi:hypothetical protein